MWDEMFVRCSVMSIPTWQRSRGGGHYFLSNKVLKSFVFVNLRSIVFMKMQQQGRVLFIYKLRFKFTVCSIATSQIHTLILSSGYYLCWVLQVLSMSLLASSSILSIQCTECVSDVHCIEWMYHSCHHVVFSHTDVIAYCYLLAYVV